MTSRLLIVLLWLMAPPTQAAFRVPPLSGPVNDEAAMLPLPVKERLAAALLRLWQEGGSQIVVLTVPTLAGESIEQAGIAVAEQWRLGRAKVDNGVLLLVAAQEHKVRIEVGRGLEGVLPDAYAKRIVAEVMVPAFRANRASDGIVAGVVAVARYTDPKASLGLGDAPAPATEGVDDEGGMPVSIGFVILLVIVVFFLSRRRSRFGGWWGGGGGGRGGGFSGGGGGFAGGGASDDW